MISKTHNICTQFLHENMRIRIQPIDQIHYYTGFLSNDRSNHVDYPRWTRAFRF